MMRTTHLMLPAGLLVLALSACGGASGGGGTPLPTPPEPSTSASPDPTATATADDGADPATTAARILVATNYVIITAADDSALADFTMYEPASAAVAEITAALGSAPAVSVRPGGLETAPATVYDWSGFALVDGEGTTIMNTDFQIEVTTATVGAAAVYTYFDLQVGGSMADAIAAGGGDSGFLDYTYVGAIPIDPVSVGESPEWDLAIQVGVEGSGGTISRIVAPVPNWGN